MTNPQDMPKDEIEIPEGEPGGAIYSILTKLIAWIVFMGCMALLVGTVVFVALALYKGILWLWPGGPA